MFRIIAQIMRPLPPLFIKLMKTNQNGYVAPEVELVAIEEQAVVCQSPLQDYDYENEPGWFNQN